MIKNNETGAACHINDNNIYRGHNIVFIVGCPRSGTTWVQRLLSCHPKVHTGQESDIFDTYIGPQLQGWRRDLDPSTSGRGGVGLGCYFREEEFMSLLREYMMKLLQPLIGDLKPGEIFLEKTPSHALFIPQIIELLPECRIINIVRDPRDVVASILAASRSWGAHWAPRHAWRAAWMWVKHVNAVRQALPKLSKDQLFEVRYENLHAQTFGKLREISNFIALDWSDDDLMTSIEKNDIKNAKTTGGAEIIIRGEHALKSGGLVREPDGFIRRAKTGSWRKDLSLSEKIQVWAVARKTMEEMGYR